MTRYGLSGENKKFDPYKPQGKWGNYSCTCYTSDGGYYVEGTNQTVKDCPIKCACQCSEVYDYPTATNIKQYEFRVNSREHDREGVVCPGQTPRYTPADKDHWAYGNRDKEDAEFGTLNAGPGNPISQTSGNKELDEYLRKNVPKDCAACNPSKSPSRKK